ncbi:beta-lactamase [Legionella beliardensis]|uniref:Beta-lactamase n=1 Tax=Legionella beliardensis TaxID=91822 RepID=A0A378I521_9GAMM|nr:serine hydrolase domain-containing protein [Legionella beliardensis]STX29942.1 beta-lactamase [Legionella beliardensis]
MLQLRVIFFALLITMHAHSQNAYLPPVFEDSKRVEKIKELFPKILQIYQGYAEEHHIPGFAFGIMVDDKLIYSGSGGYSDLSKKTPASPKSMFRIASMTKSFTAMSILKLRDEGKLRLDDPVDWYIPELKDQKLTHDAPSMTIRHLLTHSAGFPSDNPWGDRQLSMTHKEFVSLLKGISLANTTDSAFEYSNLGYALLGMIIDKVSGMPYQDYIATHIWQPLNMQQVAWDFAKVPAPELAQGYQWADGNWTQEPMLSDGVFGAMGGMITSLEAFSHYVALYQNAWPPRDDVETGPIHRSSLREMQQAWRFNQFNKDYKFLNGEPCPMVEAYGYGLRWLCDCEKKTYIGHSGGLPGFGSNWFILPDYGIGVILLTNVTYAQAADINMQVLHTLVKEAKLQSRKLPVSQLLSARQSALVKLLPDWKGVEASGLFADNFFLDSSIAARKKESEALFKKVGKIGQINPFIAESELRGYFIINGEQQDIKIHIALSPTNPALIQEYQIEAVKHQTRKG